MKPEPVYSNRKTRFLCLLLGLAIVSGVRAELFPEPDELKPDVEFWLSIFTRYDSAEGVLHDNRHLGVVYERIGIPASLSRRASQKKISNRRKALQRVLRTLASGKRENLSPEEARVLASWPADVSNATLAAAVGRIRYQQGLSDRFQEGLRRSGRWRSFIETEFATLGVPMDLAALPHVESSYNPEARSHVGASGIWQFTRSTARRYMRVDHVLDERNDPYEATRGAGRLLAYNYSITGNWPMAITAYNHGLAGVRRAMRKHGDTAYADIMRKYDGRTFGFASRNFYVAFLAARKVDQDPERYFPGVSRESPQRYDEAKLPGYIAASELAKALGVSTKQLAQHNPSLQATVWQGSKHVPRDFSLRVPAGLTEKPVSDALASIPAPRWASTQLPDMFHTVARGDTLSEIAETYDTRVSTLMTLNNLGSRNRIRAGQKLRLPAAGPMPVAVAQTPAAAVPAAVTSRDEPAAAGGDAPAVVARGDESAVAGSDEPAIVVSSAAPAVIDDDEAIAPEPIEEASPVVMVSEPVDEPAAAAQTALLSDPSDYSVGDDLTIEVQALETLGHFADWLGIKTQRLRDINGLAFRTPVSVGQRIKLQIADVDVANFESKRIAYHRQQQDRYFREHVITGVTEHVIKRGESIWILSLRQYKVPVWLFRQYNPELDLNKVRPGVTVQFPILAERDRS